MEAIASILAQSWTEKNFAAKGGRFIRSGCCSHIDIRISVSASGAQVPT